MNDIRFKIMNYAEINVYTDIQEIADSIINNVSKIIKTIPVTSFKISETREKNSKNSVEIIKGSENKMEYDKEKNVARLYVVGNEVRIYDLVYILLHMFSKILCDSKKYLIHSSALKYDDDKSILLVGEANSGKTSLAFNLMENYGMKLVSNDFTVVGNQDDLFHSYIGTKPIEMRYGVIKDKFPEVYEKFQFDGDNLWSKKTIVNDYINSDKISKDDFAHITDVFQISVIEGGDSFITTKDFVDQRLYLYQQIASQIKGTYNLITGFNYPMPSIETEENLKQLDRDIVTALDNTEIHMCKGSLDGLSKIMVRKIEKK